MSASRMRIVARAGAVVVAAIAIVLAMGGTWSVAPARATVVPGDAASDAGEEKVTIAEAGSGSGSGSGSAVTIHGKTLGGKLNLNTATAEQLELLPSVGPQKAERILTWRKKNGGFKRVADLRRVKGFGYKTFKRLEPFLDVTGETTLHH